jgi:malonate decarboxylase delta subunit
MRTLEYTFNGGTSIVHRAHVGVVASGDLEILVDTGGPQEPAQVRVRTSVDGFDAVWQRVLARFFDQNCVGGRWEINDFGATPGVVTLRLRQALQAATSGGSDD